MALPTEKTKGVSTLDRFRMVLFGQPKIGKTTLLSGFPDTLFLATEFNHESFQIYRKDIKTWPQFQAAVTEISLGKHPFKFIVIDTADILFNICQEMILAELKVKHPSDVKWGKAYDIIGKEFERELNRLFMTKYGLIFLSHTKTSEIVSRAGTTTKIVPTLPNKARAVILPKVPVIGYMHVRSIKGTDGVRRDKRVISFEPTEGVEAGNTEGKLPNLLVVPKDPHKAYELFLGYYTGKYKRKEE